MLPYWTLFLFVTIGAVISSRASKSAAIDTSLILALVIIAMMIGLRFEVGGDWASYYRMYRFAGFASLDQMLISDDPGYQVLNWLAQQIGADIWFVNMVGGAIFSWGLYRLVRSQPLPWLALLVSVPYLITVVAMGYSRQGIAIGVLMAGLAAYQRNGSIFRFAVYVMAAALFHRTAVIGLPLLLLGGGRSWIANLLIGIAGSILLYDIFLVDSIDHFVDAYVRSEMSSQGAVIRVALTLVPALFFFAFRKKLGFSPSEADIWRNFSYASLGLSVALIIGLPTTVVDRTALYILPLQIAVIPRIAGTVIGEHLAKLLIIFYCFAIQFVWLNFAAHSNYWLPYKIFPLGGFSQS